MTPIIKNLIDEHIRLSGFKLSNEAYTTAYLVSVALHGCNSLNLTYLETLKFIYGVFLGASAENISNYVLNSSTNASDVEKTTTRGQRYRINVSKRNSRSDRIGEAESRQNNTTYALQKAFSNQDGFGESKSYSVASDTSVTDANSYQEQVSKGENNGQTSDTNDSFRDSDSVSFSSTCSLSAREGKSESSTKPFVVASGTRDIGTNWDHRESNDRGKTKHTSTGSGFSVNVGQSKTKGNGSSNRTYRAIADSNSEQINKQIDNTTSTGDSYSDSQMRSSAWDYMQALSESNAANKTDSEQQNESVTTGNKTSLSTSHSERKSYKHVLPQLKRMIKSLEEEIKILKRNQTYNLISELHTAHFKYRSFAINICQILHQNTC